MNSLHIIFYLFASVAMLSGLMVVVAKNPVHGVLFLVLTFFGMAGTWVIMSAEFLALILVLVYVGAVMTLFLFVVMMLNLNTESKRVGFVRLLPFVAFIVLLVVGIILLVVNHGQYGLTQLMQTNLLPTNYSNTADLGSVLYTYYAYPFEVAGVLLLAAIIAAISLTHRPPKNRKIQIVSEQIAVRPEQRLKLINMVAEKDHQI